MARPGIPTADCENQPAPRPVRPGQVLMSMPLLQLPRRSGHPAASHGLKPVRGHADGTRHGRPRAGLVGDGADDRGLDDDADDEMDAADAAMRDPYNRKDSGQKKDDQSKTRADYSKHKDKDPKADKKAREKYDKKHKGHGARKGDQSKSKADFEEALNLEVIDDEHLTEAVLKRVVERLLRRR